MNKHKRASSVVREVGEVEGTKTIMRKKETKDGDDRTKNEKWVCLWLLQRGILSWSERSFLRRRTQV